LDVTDDCVLSDLNKSILVRITPALIKEIATLLSVIREHRLRYVSKSLHEASHAWQARYLRSPDGELATVSQVCVSDREVWFKAELGWGERKWEIETERISISTLVPEELLVPEFFEVSEQRAKAQIHSYADRIRAIEAADRLYYTIMESSGDIEAQQGGFCRRARIKWNFVV